MTEQDIVKYTLMGEAEKLGVRPQVERHLEELRETYREVRAVSENEQAGFMMAVTIFAIEIQQ